ncbi:Ig-like domain-containing protein [Mycolicibacterium sp. Dal123E01]|uniref:Ig-like domain-containing protein n=1 Tax=Mycolicibacterium sp. Dal123E01 TaxID=3457578 RepID=UPI00403EEF4A
MAQTRRRRVTKRVPFGWLGAGAVTVGLGAAVLSGSGAAYADDGGSGSATGKSGSAHAAPHASTGHRAAPASPNRKSTPVAGATTNGRSDGGNGPSRKGIDTTAGKDAEVPSRAAPTAAVHEGPATVAVTNRVNPLVKPTAVATPIASAAANPIAGFLHSVASLLGLNRPTAPSNPIGALLWGLMQQVAFAVGAAPKAGTPTANTPVTTTGLVTGALGFADASGQGLTYTHTNPTNGTVIVNDDGTYKYTPTLTARLAAAGKTGPVTDSFTVTAFNGITSSRVTVAVPISPDTPVAGTPTVNAPNAVTGAITGSVTATDPASQPLTYSVATGPTKGSITNFNAATGAFTYTPGTSAQLAAEVAGAVGADTFTISASNGAASISFTVHVVVDPGTPQVGTPTIDTADTRTGIITGATAFTDPAGGKLVYSVTANPVNGAVVLHGDGSYTYTPKPDTTETIDSFAITVTNGVHSSTETISVPINTQDAVVGTWKITSDPESTLPPDNWVATITRTGDAYSQAIVWTWSGGETETWHYGTFTRTGAGTYTATSGQSGSASEDYKDEWTADDELRHLQQFYGDDAVISDLVYNPYTVWTMKVSDDGQTITETHSVTETYTVTTPAGHTLIGYGETSFTNDGSTNVYTFDESWSETMVATRVSDSTIVDVPQAGTPIVNDPNPDTGVVTGVAVFTDPKGATLVYSVSSNPANGTITQFNSSTGAFTYTPSGDATGSTDSFEVVATNGVYRATETISVPINAIIQNSIAGIWDVTAIDNHDGSGSQNASGLGQSLVVTKTINGYTVTFTDVDGNGLPFGVLTQAVPGGLVGSVSADQQEYFLNSLKKSILDNFVALPENVVSISIDIPDFAMTGTSSATFSDAGQTMTYDVSYHLNLSTYTISLTLDDGSTTQASGDFTGGDTTVTFTAAKAVDTPVSGTPIVSAANPDTGVVTGTAVFTDPAGAQLAFSVSTNPSKGAITEFDSSTGQFTYTPNSDATGVRDSFVVTATNGVASATQTISVPINSSVQDELAGRWRVIGEAVDALDGSEPTPIDLSLVPDGSQLELTFGNANGVYAAGLAFRQNGELVSAYSYALLTKTGPGTYTGSLSDEVIQATLQSVLQSQPNATDFSLIGSSTAILSEDGQTVTWTVVMHESFTVGSVPYLQGMGLIFTATKISDVTEL